VISELITLAMSSGKRQASVWCLSVCAVWRILSVTHQGAAHGQCTCQSFAPRRQATTTVV